MSISLSFTESQTITALGNFLMSVLPNTVMIVKGQVNRVSPPPGDFITMVPTRRTRLATNEATTSDPFPAAGGSRSVMQSTQVNVQIDVHGPNSSDYTQVITTLFRDPYGCAFFAASGLDVSPLYTTEPMQMPFWNAESQNEHRWNFEAVLHAKPVVTAPQDFAGSLDVGLVSVDERYPPA